MTFLIAIGLAGLLYWAVRIPPHVHNMSDQEFNAWFATHIMGMKQ